MSDEKTELQRMEILRLSNLESNRITKECIESALVLLMKEQEFHKISITDIVRRAGVSRTAYYRNYSSKEDILNSMLQEVVDQTVKAMSLHDPVKEPFEFWYAMFQCIRPYSETFQLLLKANFGESILHQINRRVEEDIAEEDILGRYSAALWNGAAYSILTKWIESDMLQSDEEMAELCCEIIDNFKAGHQH
ncbi:TetR/AcrR family transcriptional regulator [Cytobacillus gottheilii]|uniref:TetR/AcrR family transcriptional regulator n=1 Tax=Cytobacillus gottheilii TaxID=859144 RepID=UPI0009BA7D8C|nr:TetR/AcrR family transcriptional regulator [Cytobacillus gottheilii]